MNRPYLPASLRRAETISTVVKMAGSQDPATMTTSQIAAAMGVSQGALFRHFPDKQAMWMAVLEWTRTELEARFDAIAATLPLDRLAAMMEAHIAFVVGQPGVPRILFGELQRAGDTPTKAIVRSLMQDYRQRVAWELEAARRAGTIAAQADTEAATMLFLAMVQGLVMQSLAMDDFSAAAAMARRLYAQFRTSLGSGS
ncbi:TetR/AcrR family transcriptional regulator [Sandaracinobacteroides sp. A072]|uniref:TetR/AcrR family transcriptional regulator n=1 Tax=Sandaracinobacteroides sp. A072 TaxID=3461146 RepID=UPI0040432446